MSDVHANNFSGFLILKKGEVGEDNIKIQQMGNSWNKREHFALCPALRRNWGGVGGGQGASEARPPSVCL